MDMDVILCLDDRNGMLFHHRRQSRDRVVIQDILHECEGRKLWVRPYSAALFSRAEEAISVAEDPLKQAKRGEACFVEDLDPAPYEKEIDRWIVYRWNRRYPADVWFSLDLSRGWKRVSQKEFAGHSHEKITKEIYTR